MSLCIHVPTLHRDALHEECLVKKGDIQFLQVNCVQMV